MARCKIPCERDTAMEQHHKVCVETCTGYLYDDGRVKIMGELTASNNTPIDEYREVQVILYDEDGDIVGRDYTNWTDFGLRQSFEFEFGDIEEAIAKIKAYPAT